MFVDQDTTPIIGPFKHVLIAYMTPTLVVMISKPLVVTPTSNAQTSTHQLNHGLLATEMNVLTTLLNVVYQSLALVLTKMLFAARTLFWWLCNCSLCIRWMLKWSKPCCKPYERTCQNQGVVCSLGLMKHIDNGNQTCEFCNNYDTKECCEDIKKLVEILEFHVDKTYTNQ